MSDGIVEFKGNRYRITNADGPVNYGDEITSFRGETAKLESLTRGPEYNGTAKVVVRWSDAPEKVWEYYAQVFNLTVERADA